MVGTPDGATEGHLWSLWYVHRGSRGLGLKLCANWEGRIGAGGRRTEVVFLRFFHFARRF
jgi:hypothetical protein